MLSLASSQEWRRTCAPVLGTNSQTGWGCLSRIAYVCYGGGVPASIAAAFLRRLDTALERDAVFTSGDARETALGQFGWDVGDIFGVLQVLEEEDFHLTEPSLAEEGGTIWVFVPMTDEGRIWVRLCERSDIIVVSFHRG